MTKQAHMREAELERYFAAAIKALGGHAIKLLPSIAGIPDRLVVMPPGHMYLVELKTEVGTLSQIQRFWHSRLQDVGVTVHTLYGKAHVKSWIAWACDEAYEQAQVRKRAQAARQRQREI